jgi:hypothetical protein
MLELTNQNTPSQIRVEFPAGAHAGECYNAHLSFCPNPICTCASLELALFRDPAGERETSTPEFRFEVDVIKKALYSAAEDAGKYDCVMGQAFVEQLTEDDWQLLWEQYYGYKRKITEETPGAELDTYFPADEIEDSGLMVGFHDILPFGEGLAMEMEGRRILLEDQYCVRPGCSCTDSFVELIGEGWSAQEAKEQDRPMLKVDYRTGRWRVERQGREDATLLSGVAEELVSEESRARLESRHNRLRSLYLMYKRTHRQPKRLSTAKVGRNDPCPCGSGKKYKKCCMPGR